MAKKKKEKKVKIDKKKKVQKMQTAPRSQAADKGRIPIVIAVTLAVITVEVSVMYALTIKEQSLHGMLLVHLLVVAALVAWIHWDKIRGYDLRLPVLVTVMTGVSGPVGALLSLVSVLMYLFFSRTAIDFAEWYNALFPEEEDKRTETLYERIAFGLDDVSEVENVVPFRDILVYGTLQQKQMALAKMTRYFDPEFAPVLLQAIADDSNAVRVQAAAAKTRIERHFTDTYLKWEKEIKAANQDYEKLMAFGKFCDEYAHSGILDADREQDIRSYAIALYTKAQKKKPKHPKITHALSRLYVRDGKPEKACALCKEFLKGKKVDLGIVSWYMEALFVLGEYNKIRTLAKKYRDYIETEKLRNPLISEILGAWSSTEIEPFLPIERAHGTA